MNVWDEISTLAKRILGVSEAVPADLSQISQSITPNDRPPEVVIPSPPAPPEPEEIQVLPEYEFVLAAIRTGCPAVFVTGRAGTGKSTLIRFLVGNITNCAVVAPTALAAANVGGATIHSFFGIPPQNVNPDEAADPTRKMVAVIETISALIVDEVSMVTPDLVDCMNNTLKKVRRDHSPFGGVPVIFVGDLLQLPPVVSDSELAKFFTDRYGCPFFFAADVFKETQLVPIELTKVFRQENRDFVDMLDCIRIADNHREAVARLNRECHRDRHPDASPSLFLVTTNASAKSINTRNLDELDALLYQFDAITTGNMDVQRDRFQAPFRLEIKVGAQVLFVKNKRPYWLNGTLGQVVHIEENSLRVQLRGGNTVTVERDTWEKIAYEYDPVEKRIHSTVVGTFRQFPLALGWAITIHKSQGMTLDSVRIDMGRGAFCSGQTYVALSRCKTMDGIYLDKPLSMSSVWADQMILDFYRKLNPLRDQTAHDAMEARILAKPEQSVIINSMNVGRIWTESAYIDRAPTHKQLK